MSYFWTLDLCEKVREVQEIHQDKLCDNLGTYRTESWPIIFNFLIALVDGEFNFRCTRAYWNFWILNFYDDWRVPRLDLVIFGSQSWIVKIDYILTMKQIQSVMNHSRFELVMFCSRLEILIQSANLNWSFLFKIWPFLGVFILKFAILNSRVTTQTAWLRPVLIVTGTGTGAYYVP